MAIFNDRMTSIEMCVNRFDEDTKASFLDLYTKIDAGVNMDTVEGVVPDPYSDIMPVEDIKF